MNAARTADGTHLRLVWPQWQGAGTSSVAALLPELPLAVARRGYAVGTRVLQAVLPPHDGPTAVVPVSMDDDGLAQRDGVEAKEVVLRQLGSALGLLREHDAARVTTVGGDCAVSMAPFAHLAARYGGDLAVVWVDSHPDLGTGASGYPGYHAMVVSGLTGHGDPDLLAMLPATLPGSRVALAGMLDWPDDTLPADAAAWGISVFGPDALRASTAPLLDWLRSTGVTKVAVHLDVDTVDADEVQLGLGYDRGGLSVAQANRVVVDLAAEAEVVALTVAEYVPRQVMQLQRLLDGLPLLGS